MDIFREVKQTEVYFKHKGHACYFRHWVFSHFPISFVFVCLLVGLYPVSSMMQPVHKLAQPHSSARGEQNKRWFGKEEVDQVPAIESILLSSYEIIRPVLIYLFYHTCKLSLKQLFGRCFADM